MDSYRYLVRLADPMIDTQIKISIIAHLTFALVIVITQIPNEVRSVNITDLFSFFPNGSVN